MLIHKNDVPFPTLVMSGDVQWVPIGDQATQVSQLKIFNLLMLILKLCLLCHFQLGEVIPVHNDILIAKMRPGQVRK